MAVRKLPPQRYGVSSPVVARCVERVAALHVARFAALFAIPQEHHKLVVDSVVWAFKHTERTVAETGLEILLELLVNVGRVADAAGVELVTLDPLGDGNWIEMMRSNLDALVRGLSAGAALTPSPAIP